MFSTDRIVRQELIRNATAGDIMSGVYGVRYLMHEYIIGHEERARVQLTATQKSLSRLFVAPRNSTPAEAELLDRLRQADTSVRSLFSDIVRNYETTDADERKGAMFHELEERLTGQIMIRIESMVSAAAALSEQSRLGVLRAQNHESAAVAAFGVIVLLTFALIVLVGMKSIFRPLERLRSSVALVGAGDFGIRMDESQGDEISDLARAFNDMIGKLRDRDAKIRRLVDSNIIGIVICDVTGTILEANEAFLQMVGYDAPDVRTEGLHVDRIARPESGPAHLAALRQAQENATYSPFETELLHKDGRRIPVMMGGALIEGDPVSIVSFVLDLTERRLAQEALSRTRAELTHVARVSSLGALTASIAHEVNQPLSGIVTNASTCLRMLGAEPPNVTGARETALRTIRDGNRAAAVVKRLRALFTKSETAREPVNLNEAISEVFELLRVDIRRGRVDVRTEFFGDLPDVVGDRVQIQQVILNLIVNAMDAMGAIDGPRELGIKTDVGAGQVLVTVRDNGSGLSEAAEKVFDSFYTTKAGGMGIGLSISRSIIESHGGKLWAEPNAGPGAIFQFSLPISSTGVDSDASSGAVFEAAGG
ncbi:ATP-binding protein [Bradyrhizobium sp. McL0616]|uniref:sensor histidine kinase n=1 Tax=Bradyrhizobium sp. McL0616 TaxID=3415674 RepID=UPI003CF83834